MARLILLAHAPLASALAAVALHAFPELGSRIQALDVPAAEPPEHTERRVRALIEAPGPDGLAAQGADAEVLILTDVFGATPTNVAQRAADRPGVRVLAGVNVPMLWRALNYAGLPLDDLVTRCIAGGTQGVLPIASTRPQNQAVQTLSHDYQQHHHQQ